MKKLILLTAAVMAVAACQKNVQVEDPKSDAISIAPESRTFDAQGGAQQVLVTSSAAWTLTPADTYDWISPDITEGVDGDIVTFTVKENTSDKEFSAVYTFTAGEATTEFTAILRSGDFRTIELTSSSEVEVPYYTEEVQVTLKTNVNYRALIASVSEDAADWLSYRLALEGSDNVVTMVFSLQQNDTDENRSGEITISAGEGVAPVTISVTQRTEPVIKPAKNAYYLSLDATSLEIPVTANVEYEVKTDADWLEYEGNKDGVETFSMSSTSAVRSAEVTFTEKDPIDGIDPVVAKVTVSQKESALVNWAVDMKDARLFPETWKNASALNNLTALTLEALIRPDDFAKNKMISTIMGIENKFLVRIGDSGIANNQIQIATSVGNFTNENLRLNTGEWYHIAVTFDMYQRRIKCYINGVLCLEEPSSILGAVNFGVPRGNETGSNNNITRVFWIGYSYEPVRDFDGLMTELRIWNKALSADEINEANHFYTVDPASDGLVAYWKCDEGQGTTVRDYSSSGNDCTGQTGLYQEGSGDYVYTTGDTNINWVEVSLP